MNLDETDPALLLLRRAREYVAAMDAARAQLPVDETGETEQPE